MVLEATGGDVLNQSLQSAGTIRSHRHIRRCVARAQVGQSLRHARHESSLITYYVGGWSQSRPQQAVAALQKLIGFIKSGEIHVQIGHILPLSKAADAHRLLAERASAGKIILKPWGETA